MLWLILSVLWAADLNVAMNLTGENVCMKSELYNVTNRIQIQVPVTFRTFTWCFRIPPRCSKYRTEKRISYKTEIITKKRPVRYCCEGYIPNEEQTLCIPFCEDPCIHGICNHPNHCDCESGFHKELCDEGCPHFMWGKNCANKCKCSNSTSLCNSLNGDCECIKGWTGRLCDQEIAKETTVEIPQKICDCKNLENCDQIPSDCAVTTEDSKVNVKNFTRSSTSTEKSIYKKNNSVIENDTHNVNITVDINGALSNITVVNNQEIDNSLTLNGKIKANQTISLQNETNSVFLKPSFEITTIKTVKNITRQYEDVQKNVVTSNISKMNESNNLSIKNELNKNISGSEMNVKQEVIKPNNSENDPITFRDEPEDGVSRSINHDSAVVKNDTGTTVNSHRQYSVSEAYQTGSPYYITNLKNYQEIPKNVNKDNIKSREEDKNQNWMSVAGTSVIVSIICCVTVIAGIFVFVKFYKYNKLSPAVTDKSIQASSCENLNMYIVNKNLDFASQSKFEC